MATEASAGPLFIFLDEGGDLNFSPTGSKYFSLTSITVTRPFVLQDELTNLRYDLIETGVNLEYFHATTDKQRVRDSVFGLLAPNLNHFRVDAVIVEKRKTGPALREETQFYPRMLGYLLRYVVERTPMSKYSEVIVITDVIPINKKRNAVEKAVKQTLSKMLPAGTQYRCLHHASKSSVQLQIADYFNWAIFRKWERGDPRSHLVVKAAIYSEFDIFRTGITHYY